MLSGPYSGCAASSNRAPAGLEAWAMSTKRMMPPIEGMNVSRYIQPLWLVSCNRRMPRDSEGTNAARLTSAMIPHMEAKATPTAVSEPLLAATAPRTISDRTTIRTVMTMKVARTTHQYSLRDARPEKFFQFLSHSLTAWTIVTEGRGVLSYTAVYGARPPAYCCP